MLQLQHSEPHSERFCKQKTRSVCVLLPLQQSKTYGFGLPGKRGRGRDGINLLFKQTMNEMLPVIRVHTNEMPCTALLDTSCSQTIVSAGLCCVWKKRSIRVTTISSEMCKCHRIGTVKVCVDTKNSADVKVLVVHERPLNFNQLLVYDAMIGLGGVLITWTGIVKFCKEASPFVQHSRLTNLTLSQRNPAPCEGTPSCPQNNLIGEWASENHLKVSYWLSLHLRRRMTLLRTHPPTNLRAPPRKKFSPLPEKHPKQKTTSTLLLVWSWDLEGVWQWTGIEPRKWRSTVFSQKKSHTLSGIRVVI